MQDQLNSHSQTLENLNRQRILWLRISGFIAVSILIILFDWNLIYKYNLSILVVSIGLLVSVVWWYWTMSIIRKLIEARINEARILVMMSLDIEEMKTLLKNSHTTIDK
jgi:hypothetical protein